MIKTNKSCASAPLISLMVFTLVACGGGAGTEGGDLQQPNATDNQAPAVSAGDDFTLNLPNTASLLASASDDAKPLGSELALSWSKVSGPGTVTFVDANSASSDVAFSQGGSYVLGFSASDGQKSTSDTITVVVNPAISVGGYVLKAAHSLPVTRTLPSDPQAQIQFTEPNGSSGLTTLSASAGTFENNATLYVINLSTQRKYQFTAQGDGGLVGAQLFAPYGSELLVRVDHGMSAEHLAGLPSEQTSFLNTSYISDFLQLDNDESLRSASGFRLNILPNSIGAREFYSVGLAHHEESNFPVALHGTVAKTLALDETSQPNINMSLRLFAQGTLDSPVAIFALKPTHNTQGKPLGVLTHFVATQTDALGNMISRQLESRTTMVDGLELTASSNDINGMNFTVNQALNFGQYENESHQHPLQDGHYLLEFSLGHNQSELTVGSSVSGATTQVLHTGNTLLLPIEVGGNLEIAQEPLVFFMDTTQDGYVGLYDRQAFPNFGLNLISNMLADKPILQRFHPDGRLREYDFSPFFPRLSAADRNSPSILFMDLDAKNSAIQITLTPKDGQAIIFPEVSGQYLRHRHDKNLNLSSRSQGGVHMTDILQMALNDETGDYQTSFATSGDYQLKVTGTLTTINGKSMLVDQTMSFTVADYLVTPLYSTLPMMPLQAGESITPMVTLMPAIPAQVEVAISYAVNSESPSTTTFTGIANKSGIFVADTAMLFSEAGIYSVNIKVSHTDEVGNVYAGNRNFSSVVSDANPQIFGHGKRGIDNLADYGLSANRWFSRDALNRLGDGSYDIGTGHVLAPFEQGDIEWVEEDVAAVVRAAIGHEAQLAASGAQCQEANLSTWESTQELIIDNCVPRSFAQPLSNTLPTAGFTAYSYNAAERFSVRVRESVGDEHAHGYWRFDDSYGNQRGMGTVGDKSSEVKFQFIGTAVTDFNNSKTHYTSHASLFVLTAADGASENDTRVFPPFNGHGIQPGGGAILKLANRDVDGFIWPTTLIPGSVLKKGDALPFYGQMAPTLPMEMDLNITAPDGSIANLIALANNNGFVQSNNVTFNQIGVYRIQPKLTYKQGQATSAGELQADFVIDHALLAADNDYYVFVTDTEDTIPMNINFNTSPATPSTLDLASAPTFRVLEDDTTKHLTDVMLYTSVFMDGWIIEQKVQSTSELSSLAYTLDLSELAKTFNTIDVGDPSGRATNYTDLIRVSFMLQGRDSKGAKKVFTRTFTLDGENVLSN